MYTVLQALHGQTPRLPGLTAQNRLLLLVGHDTNLANLSGLLQTPWSLPGQPDNTPPGGELRFERWRDSTGRAWVRVSVVYQSLAQLRRQSRLTLPLPPHQMTLALPGCRGDGGWPLSTGCLQPVALLPPDPGVSAGARRRDKRNGVSPARRPAAAAPRGGLAPLSAVPGAPPAVPLFPPIASGFLPNAGRQGRLSLLLIF